MNQLPLRTRIAGLFKKYEALIIPALLSTIFMRNLVRGGYPAGTDMLGWIARANFLSIDFRSMYIYSAQSFGAARTFTLETPLAMVNTIIGNPAVTVELTLAFFIVLAGASIFSLTRFLFQSRLAAYLSSFIYLSNQFFLSQVASGHLEVLGYYALLPLALRLFISVVQNWSPKESVKLATVLALMAFMLRADSLIYFSLCALAWVTVQMKGLSLRSAIHVAEVKRVFVAGGTGLAVFILAGAFAILPLLAGSVPSFVSYGRGYTLEKVYGLGIGDTFLGKARELGYLADSGLSWDQHPFLGHAQLNAVMAVLPALALGALVIVRNRTTLFLAVVGFGSALLATNPLDPYGVIGRWLFLNVPLLDLLRVSNRWLILTYLAYSILAAVSLSWILREVKRVTQGRRSRKNGTEPRLVLPTLRHAPVACVLLALVMVMMFSAPQLYASGIPTWKPQPCSKAFDWVRGDSGEFRVATLPYGQKYSDDTGWSEHDLGLESSLFHNKPVVGIGESSPYSSSFLSHTFKLVAEMGTNRMSDLLGAFDVKYVVSPCYDATEPWPTPIISKEFFSRQAHSSIVYSREGSVVYRLEGWKPHIFASTQYAVLVGGFDAMTALLSWEDFDLSSMPLLFSDQVSDVYGPSALKDVLRGAQRLMFVDSEPMDLYMDLVSSAERIRAIDHAQPFSDGTVHWVRAGSFSEITRVPSTIDYLHTSGNVTLVLPATVEDDGMFQVWVKVGYGQQRGNLTVSLDGHQLGSVHPFARNHPGLSFRWVRIGSQELGKGMHSISLSNQKSSASWDRGNKNDVDQIIIVRGEELERVETDLRSMLDSTSVGIDYVLTGQYLFKWAARPDFYNWWPLQVPFESTGGFLASSKTRGYETSASIPLAYETLRNQTLTATARVSVGPEEGNLSIRVDTNEEQITLSDANPAHLRWVRLGNFSVTSSTHNIRLDAEGRVELDQLVISDLAGRGSRVDVSPSISFERVSPVEFRAKLTSEGKATVVLSESFSAGWQAIVNGKVIRPLPAYGFVNAFLVDNVGETVMTLEYAPQKLATLGGLVSLASILTSLLALTITRSPIRKARARVTSWKARAVWDSLGSQDAYSAAIPSPRQRVDPDLTLIEHIRPGSIVLDAGCGYGRNTLWLAKAPGITLVACDLSATMSKSVKQSGVPLVLSDVRSLPFRNDSFDFLVCSLVLLHLPFRSFSVAIQELARVGKVLLIILPNPFGPSNLFGLRPVLYALRGRMVRKGGTGSLFHDIPSKRGYLVNFYSPWTLRKALQKMFGQVEVGSAVRRTSFPFLSSRILFRCSK